MKLLSFALATALAALPMGNAMAETPIKMAVETPPGDPLNLMLTTFRDTLTEGGGFTPDFYESGALGDEAALTELLRAGQVDVVPLGSDVVELDSKFAVFDLPFLFDDKATARAALDGALGEKLAASLRETTGLQVLAFGELGFRAISNSVRPIETPADLAGLKLRTPGSQTRIMAFTALGAAPTPMPLGEVYVALRQGVIDGQENPLSVVQEFSFDEVQEFVSLTNHVYTPITLAMAGSAWDALSPEEQAAVTAAAKAGAEATRVKSDESDASLVAEFEAAGMKVNTPDLAAFKEAAAPLRAEFAAIVGEEFLTEVEGSLK
ncbi:TRAP transporter substrate-binding protein [Vannielia litorea]|uniref:TRAP transporter substrate-binding protein n=1 Tax=Vannielia litorea TaxID=1217970 RepID=UPI001C960679|nr:TRAP transporter substrate-binding protein [Vannielia litorea]MBY6048565.1 TRAP transporter substrate-binding protein [Vannielia litorea]MBY6075979.1 TRAP transporter substrate-binding protein [Vannielia litorea]MBY6154195.1 TRAP transporter substrate-binding protein [Vannielia litorea]